jgi:hypothetical protein
MRAPRAAAIVTWIYSAGFGLPAPLVAAYLLRHGRLPSFFGLFDMYGGPWSGRLSDTQFTVRLSAFALLLIVPTWSGWLLWKGRRSGAVLNVVSLPIEVVFWLGFALPIPWILAGQRVALVALSWPLRPTTRDSSMPRTANEWW